MEEVLRFYYSSPRSPIGTEGDFYTSSDLDPIFGRLDLPDDAFAVTSRFQSVLVLPRS